MRYPAQPSTFMRILWLATRYWWPTIKRTYLILLLSLICQYLYLEIFYLQPREIIDYVVYAVIALLQAYLWIAFVLGANDALTDDVTPLNQLLVLSLSKLLDIVMACVVFFVGTIALYKLGTILSALVLVHWMGEHELAYVGVTVFGGLPIIFCSVLFYLAIPLVILRPLNLFQAFVYSAKISLKQWFRVFGVYFLSIILLLLFAPNTRLGNALMHSQSDLLIDVLVAIFLYPFYINSLLLILNDAERRYQN